MTLHGFLMTKVTDIVVLRIRDIYEFLLFLTDSIATQLIEQLIDQPIAKATE